MATKIEDVLETISGLTILEAAELKTAMEEKFGIVAASGGGGAAAAGEEEAAKTDFDVELTAAGSSKISVIKIVREITGLGLKEAKDIVESAPKVIKEALPQADADAMKAKLEEAGATVTLK